MADQTEKAFQKQDAVYGGARSTSKKSMKSQRWYKSVGLGFKTPKEAIEGTYVDKKCPFTSNVSIRGRILRGVCVSTKMKRTVIVRRDYLHFVKKYSRFEKRHSNTPAHVSPAFVALKEGDVVTIGECRPLSKTVRFNVLKVDPQLVTSGNIRKQFRLF
eukprot:c46705_g1_i1.p1 GENE.c46705_g1_i1~~c46705_g1_i1.p1  ORF type:complete len:159 (+),score=0.95 c46705_g1_i1:43-519(+)